MSNLFIALGGAGCKSISKLQQDYKRYYQSEGIEDPNFYLYIDTDREEIRGLKEDVRTKIIDLSAFNPIEHYERKRDDIKKWFDIDSITIPPYSLKSGLKAIRQLARMAFYCDAQVINDINGFLASIYGDHALALNANSNDFLKFYVVSGTVGGTGGGIFLDVLYILWRYRVTQGLFGNHDITAVLLMPSMFLEGINDPSLTSHYMQNGYAFFEEINALLRYSQHNDNNDLFFNFVPAAGHRTFRDIGKRWMPFSRAILFDNMTSSFKIDHDDMYEIIANFLLTYTIGNNSQERIHSDNNTTITVFDALESALTNTIPSNLNGQYLDIFNSAGLVVTKVAYEEFHQFAENQLKIDLLNSISKKTDETKSREISEELYNLFAERFEKIENTLLEYDDLRFKKSDQEQLKNILLALDFEQNIPALRCRDCYSNALLAFVNSLMIIKEDFDTEKEKLKDIIYKFHEYKLINGYSIQTFTTVH